MDIAIMIEGQNGLNWPRWQKIVRAVEDLGFAGLYRSDHFVNTNPPDQDSLELWVSLTWLAGNTSRIEFGPMVTPVSFRHPSMLVRMASAVDDLSKGRLIFGVGAGWNEREHANYSFDLLDVASRFERFEEALKYMRGVLKQDKPVALDGKHYQFKDAVLLPRPQRPGGPPILIGGSGPKRTLPLVAAYADEWNGVFITAARFAELNAQLTDLLVAQHRAPETVRRSLMTGVIFGQDDAAVRARLSDYGADSIETAISRGLITGTPAAVVDQLGHLAESGVQRVMLQWLNLDDLAGLEALSRAVL
jgi:F420-dependent oxidoreductase-like protein